MGPPALKLQSASCQIAYWEDGGLRIVNYLTRRTFATQAITLELLRFFSVPRTIARALLEFAGYSCESVARAILQLIDAQLLLEHGSAEWQRDRFTDCIVEALASGRQFPLPDQRHPVRPRGWPLEEKMKLLPATPAPRQFKTLRDADVVRLSPLEIERDTFFRTLFARRTHREFGRGKVSLSDISKLLQTTWGVQGYFEANVLGRLPYKTSPSGGARHPGEVYLVALRVDGLERGIYHYQAKDNRLARIPAKGESAVGQCLLRGSTVFRPGGRAIHHDRDFCQDHVEIRQRSSLSGGSARDGSSVSDVLSHGNQAGTGSIQHGCAEGLVD